MQRLPITSNSLKQSLIWKNQSSAKNLFIYLKDFAVSGFSWRQADNMQEMLQGSMLMHMLWAKYIAESHHFSSRWKSRICIFYQLAIEKKMGENNRSIVTAYQQLNFTNNLYTRWVIFPKKMRWILEQIVQFIDSRKKFTLIQCTDYERFITKFKIFRIRKIH